MKPGLLSVIADNSCYMDHVACTKIAFHERIIQIPALASLGHS